MVGCCFSGGIGHGPPRRPRASFLLIFQKWMDPPELQRIEDWFWGNISKSTELSADYSKMGFSWAPENWTLILRKHFLEQAGLSTSNKVQRLSATKQCQPPKNNNEQKQNINTGPPSWSALGLESKPVPCNQGLPASKSNHNHNHHHQPAEPPTSNAASKIEQRSATAQKD